MKGKCLMIRVLLVTCTLLAAVSPNAAELRFSGILGQSQPPNEKPFPSVGAQACAVDGAGRIWVAPGGASLLRLDTSLKFIAAEMLLPVPVRLQSSLRHVEGEGLFAIGNDGRAFQIDTENLKAVPVGKLPPDTNDFTIVPVKRNSSSTGIDLLVLKGKSVMTIGCDGNPSELFTLPEEKAPWCSIGVEPTSGDILAGTTYPDTTIHRFTRNGREVKEGGWPRPGWADLFVTGHGNCWMLSKWGRLQALPEKLSKADKPESHLLKWLHYSFGIAFLPDGFVLASSQGVVFTDHRGNALRRMGGMPDVRAMALAPDGTVIAAVEKGSRMARLSLDDEPDIPFTSNANEPWRVGNGWKGTACALAWDGQGFLVLDDSQKRLWRFLPDKTNWGENPWIPLTEEGVFVKPRSLTLSEGNCFVLDDDRILVSKKDMWKFTPLPIPPLEGACGISAADDNSLIVALQTGVILLKLGKDGVWKEAWRVQGMHVTSVAVAEKLVLVTETEALIALSLSDGSELCRANGALAGSPMRPGAVAVSGRWALVGDELGKRIIRFKIW
ncbi:MAG: hypothetical protein WAX69_16805 [Victivallales bacterium]